MRRLTQTLRLESLEERNLLSASPAGPEFRVNFFTDGDQYLYADDKHAVAAGSTGSVIVWSSYDTQGNGSMIFARLFDPEGNPVGIEFPITPYPFGYRDKPEVAMAADGTFVVVWETWFGDGASYGIFAQRFGTDGTPLSDALQVNTTTEGNQESPALAMADDGSFVITWMSYAPSGAGPGIYARLFSPDADILSPEFKVAASTVNADQPDIAMDPSGNFVIVWQDLGPGPLDDVDVYGQRFGPDGTPAGTEFRVNQYTQGAQSSPALAMAADGTFVVTWMSDGQDNAGLEVYARRFGVDDRPLAREFRVNTLAFGVQGFSAVAMDQRGNFAITWSASDGGSTGYDVYARRYSSAGIALDDGFQLASQPAFNQFDSSAAYDPAGNLLIVWTGYGLDETTSLGVFARRYLPPPRDDYDETNPTTLKLSPDGSGTFTGTIEAGGDLDLFRFVAPVTGFMTVWQTAPPSTRFAGFVSAFSAAGEKIDISQVGGGIQRASGTIFEVVAGRTYYVLAQGFTAQSYELTFGTWVDPVGDDFGDTLAKAAPLTLSASNSALQAGSLDTVKDADVFRFVAQGPAVMGLSWQQVNKLAPVPHLAVFDQHGKEIKIDRSTSFMLFPVVAGQTYYIKVTTDNGRTGPYVFSMEFVNPTIFTDPTPAPAPPPPPNAVAPFTPAAISAIGIDQRVDLRPLNGSALALVSFLVTVPADGRNAVASQGPASSTGFIIGLNLTPPANQTFDLDPSSTSAGLANIRGTLLQVLSETYGYGRMMARSQAPLLRDWVSTLGVALDPVGDLFGRLFGNTTVRPAAPQQQQNQPPEEEETDDMSMNQAPEANLLAAITLLALCQELPVAGTSRRFNGTYRQRVDRLYLAG